MLAGISAEYYLRLEVGRDKHPSPQVIAHSRRRCGWTPKPRSICSTWRPRPEPTSTIWKQHRPTHSPK